MARLTTVTWATDRYGNNGFNWSHIYAGTLLTIFTVIAALITLTRLALPKPTQQNKPAMPSTRSGGPASL